MVKILRGGISWEKIKRWVKIRIRIEDIGNLFVGTDAGLVTSGNYNNFVGYRAGYKNTSGSFGNFMGYQTGYSSTTGLRNNFIGCQAGYSNTSGQSNNFMGYQTGFRNTSGQSNCFVGASSGYSNTTGVYNCFTGALAGYSNVDGQLNTFIGYVAGHDNVSGHRNVFIGSNAGRYETGSDKLFIDNAARTNEADARVKALIYGLFDAATANQLLRINGILELTEIKNGTTQANAGAAANEVWKTNGHASLPDNVLMIGV